MKIERIEQQLAVRYTRYLSKKRADSLNEWMQVGKCLHNIADSLLDVWIEFSKRSTKFKEGECEDLWHTFGSKSDLGLNIDLGLGTLYRWYILDNGN